MHEMLEKYLADKEKEIAAVKQDEKDRLLRLTGLCEKVYCEDPHELVNKMEYPNSEWDEATRTRRYFKSVPITITDAEYEMLKAVIAEENGNLAESYGIENRVVKSLNLVAVIELVVGLIAGLVIAVEQGTFIIAVILWSVTVINCVFIRGFAEIVNLLNAILNRVVKKK